jgi:hypothetical protein
MNPAPDRNLQAPDPSRSECRERTTANNPAVRRHHLRRPPRPPPRRGHPGELLQLLRHLVQQRVLHRQRREHDLGGAADEDHGPGVRVGAGGVDDGGVGAPVRRIWGCCRYGLVLALGSRMGTQRRRKGVILWLGSVTAGCDFLPHLPLVREEGREGFHCLQASSSSIERRFSRLASLSIAHHIKCRKYIQDQIIGIRCKSALAGLCMLCYIAFRT